VDDVNAFDRAGFNSHGKDSFRLGFVIGHRVRNSCYAPARWVIGNRSLRNQRRATVARS
jgi:hypothetical protein